MGRIFRCPMCGGEVQLTAGICLNCGEKYLPNETEVAAVRRELKRWVIQRSVFAGGLVFFILLVFRLPEFFGSPRSSSVWILDSIVHCAIAGTAALIAAGATGVRAWWFLQEVHAVRGGFTTAHHLGRLFSHIFRKRPKA